METNAKVFLGLLVLTALIAIIVVVPFAVIWALNTVFALSITYTWKTWLAVTVLNLIYNGGAIVTQHKK